MRRSTFKRCFVSAPFGTDTVALRKALEQRNIIWRDSTTIGAHTSWLAVLTQEVKEADFVCMIVPEDHESNILFELGVAFASGKPILAFVKAPQTLPSEIRSLTYFLSDPTDPTAVGAALDTFLAHAQPATRQRGSIISSTRKTRPKKIEKSPARLLGESAEKQTADLLRQAGFIISEQPMGGGRGADLAVWADELESFVGGPLLVEIKSGELSERRLQDAAEQLRHHVSSTHGRFGLLIYWDQNGREFPQTSAKWPFIFQLSGRALTTLIEQERLGKELVRLRNAAVHGVA